MKTLMLSLGCMAAALLALVGIGLFFGVVCRLLHLGWSLVWP